VREGKGSGSERGERGAEEMEWGSYYLGNVFEEWPGEVRRPWNGDPPALAVHFNHWYWVRCVTVLWYSVIPSWYLTSHSAWPSLRGFV